MVMELTGTSFDEHVIKGKKPVIVDFWAAWCGPCKMLSPILEDIEPEYKGKLQFAKLNVDENETISREYGIMSIPCLVIFSHGKEVDRIVGLMPKPQLKKLIDDALKKAK